MKRIILLFALLSISFSLMGRSDKPVRVGVDATLDCFDSSVRWMVPSYGIGVRARLGRTDQWFNLVGGLRYIYGTRLSGPQIPVMLNVNTIRGKKRSFYLGCGYEFDFLGTYWGCAKFQAGLAGKNLDFRVFYKPYQGDLGFGVSWYF